MAAPATPRDPAAMSRFTCHAMDPAAAERFRRTLRDDRGGAVVRRQVDGPGFPCRHCLRLGAPGEAMLLASWDLPLPQGPYWTPSPVFLHAEPCPHGALADALPETVTANSLVSLRHYDAEGLCLYDLGVVVAGEAAEAALRERIGDPRVAYVNIHTARPGCWLARVTPGPG
jgi:hypothetical protein